MEYGWVYYRKLPLNLPANSGKLPNCNITPVHYRICLINLRFTGKPSAHNCPLTCLFTHFTGGRGLQQSRIIASREPKRKNKDEFTSVQLHYIQDILYCIYIPATLLRERPSITTRPSTINPFCWVFLLKHYFIYSSC